MANGIMNIVVDDRETPSGIADLLESSGNKVIRKRIIYGDYLIDGKLVVERKTAEDFVVSIIDGRLFRQLRNLKKLRLRIVLMVEGNPYKTGHAIELEAVRGALTSVSVIWQVPIIFSSSLQDSARLLQVMADQVRVSQDVVPLRGGYRPKRLKNRQLFIIQGLSGVGAKLARRLLRYFKTVSGVFSASINELTEVEGVGSVKAIQIRGVLDVRINTALSS